MKRGGESLERGFNKHFHFIHLNKKGAAKLLEKKQQEPEKYCEKMLISHKSVWVNIAAWCVSAAAAAAGWQIA